MMRPLGLTALMFVMAVAGAEGRALDLNEAVALAEKQNLALSRSAADRDAKARQDANAWNVLVPSVSLGAGVSRANEGPTVLGVQQDPNWNYSNSLSLSLSVTPSLLTDLKRVRLNRDGGEMAYETARRSLEKNVRLVFSSLLVEEESLKLARDNQTRKEKSLADARTKYKAGLIPELDLLSAQVAAESLKPSLAQQETAHQNNLGQFLALLGLPLDETLQLKGSLPDIGAVNAPAGSSSLEVRAAEMNVTAAQLAAESSKIASWLPSLSLSWSKAPGLTLTDGAEWADSGSFSLRLSYALDGFFPWSQAKERLTQADEAVKAQQSLLDEARVNAQLKRSTALRKIEQARTSLQTQEFNIQLAQKTLNLTQEAYNRGTKDLDALQTAEANLNQARYDQLSQRYSLLSAVLDLEYELNVPFGTLGGQ